MTVKLKKVLIVEDSPIQAKMYRLLFNKNDCELFFAENGNEALQTLTRELNINLIITDINMPEMDGIEFIGVVKRTGLATCPIIVASTKDNQKLLEQAVENGASAFVVKPWDLGTMRKLIEKLVY